MKMLETVSSAIVLMGRWSFQRWSCAQTAYAFGSWLERRSKLRLYTSRLDALLLHLRLQFFRQLATEKFSCQRKIRLLSPWWASGFLDATMPEFTRNSNNKAKRCGCWEWSIRT